MIVLEKDRKKSHNADYVVCIPKPLNAGARESWSHIFCVYLESDLRNKEGKDYA